MEKYTAAHWGTYKFDGQGDLLPVDNDPSPSRIGKGWVSAVKDKYTRILAPVVRKGWLDGDGGANRCHDTYIEISWQEAAKLAAGEINRVNKTRGNSAIFGGSYGWSSAGRVHHAQSQLRRFLNLAGGFVSSRETYSHAAAEVLFPHVLGLTNRAFQDQMTSLPLVAEHCEFLLCFGGISKRTAQITSSGTSTHDVGTWLEGLTKKGVKIANVSPQRSDMEDLGAEWVSIRPGTDTAFLMALSYEIISRELENKEFLQKYTSGWNQYRAYLLGETDGQIKDANWASTLCDIDSDAISDMALRLAKSRSMISVAWGIQRADHGEQPLWAALNLACIIGQIGQAGTGFSFGYGSTTPVGRPSKLIGWPSLPQGQNPIDDFIPVARIADMLLKPGQAYKHNGDTRTYPDIKLVYWTGGNPFHHHQDLNRLEKAWCKPETVIVNEHTWTATARRADIVLPATTPLERNDIMLNRRDPSLIYMSQLFEPLGQSKDDFEIFSMLSRELGFEENFTENRSSNEWLVELWDQSKTIGLKYGFELPDLATFKEDGRFDVPDSTETRIALEAFTSDPCKNPLDTESGRITMFNAQINAMKLNDCAGHPVWLPPIESLIDADDNELHLISGQPDTRLHSQNDRGLESLSNKIRGREPACLNPEAAKNLNLNEGDIIQLYNKRGACLAGLRLDDGLRADCISLSTGAWLDLQEIDGQVIDVHGNPNVLTLDKGTSELAQGNIAHTTLVRVKKWTKALPELSIDKPPIIQTIEE